MKVRISLATAFKINNIYIPVRQVDQLKIVLADYFCKLPVIITKLMLDPTRN